MSTFRLLLRAGSVLVCLLALLLSVSASAQPGQVLKEGTSENCINQFGQPVPCPLSYWPPGLSLPAGCDPSKPSSIGNCTLTRDICTNLPGFIVAGDACVPENMPSHCPVGLPFNPVMNDPHCQRYSLKPKQAVDPNDKSGTVGAGSAQFIANSQPLAYTLHFENLATATAPAQVVVVTDQLDPQEVNLGTFELGPIAFGNVSFVPPPGLQTYRSGIDLRPAQDVIVTVEALLNATTGLATWTFTSIDPATGEVTQDPDDGFLPPNASPPAGEGSVTFMVMPRSGLATGTAIVNQGRIVFDLNNPILTPTWTNTIDGTSPASHVLPLAAAQSSASFPVQWTGTDNGSGVQTFAVFVSDNGGTFTTWLDGTIASSGTYSGQVGHTYAFFSLARDAVGNVEPAKTTADATTRVAGACALNVTSQLQITRSGFGYNLATGRFTQTVTLKNASTSAITGPLSLALDNLSSNATLFNASGTTACALPEGNPFVNWSSSLAPGSSASILLQFTNPSRAGITYATRVLAGTAGR